jgi:hypothetical protein
MTPSVNRQDVKSVNGTVHHRDTERTETAQREAFRQDQRD